MYMTPACSYCTKPHIICHLYMPSAQPLVYATCTCHLYTNFWQLSTCVTFLFDFVFHNNDSCHYSTQCIKYIHYNYNISNVQKEAIHCPPPSHWNFRHLILCENLESDMFSIVYEARYNFFYQLDHLTQVTNTYDRMGHLIVFTRIKELKNLITNIFSSILRSIMLTSQKH